MLRAAPGACMGLCMVAHFVRCRCAAFVINYPLWGNRVFREDLSLSSICRAKRFHTAESPEPFSLFAVNVLFIIESWAVSSARRRGNL